jgi:hypothetical protein
MNQKDLKQIEELFNKGFTKAFGLIWEFNLEPALTEIQNRLDNLQNKVTGLEATVSNLPTKQYVDDKIADLKFR